MIADAHTTEILATAFCEGSRHDLRLFKDSRHHISPRIQALADAGYQGLKRLHANSRTPAKKSQRHPLSPEQRSDNRVLAHVRIRIEHIFRKLKVFRILSERYRNRRQRFGLRFNLIAAIYNLELECAK